MNLSENYSQRRTPGPCGAGVPVTGTDSSVRSAALTVGRVYRITAYGGGGYVKFGGSTVEAASGNYDFFMGVEDIGVPTNCSVDLCDLGLMTIREGYDYIAVLRQDTNNCTVILTPYS